MLCDVPYLSLAWLGVTTAVDMQVSSVAPSPLPITPSTRPIPPITLYFAYGSNLWLKQMSFRCPEATYLGMGLLQGARRA